MSRRNLRTLSLREAAARTRLSVDRIQRAVTAGQIRAFRDDGKSRRGAWRLLETSFEDWFERHCVGGPADSTPADAAVDAAVREAFDPDAELIAMTAPEDRFV